jgi:hypothetical protein
MALLFLSPFFFTLHIFFSSANQPVEAFKKFGWIPQKIISCFFLPGDDLIKFLIEKVYLFLSLFGRIYFE